MATHRTSTRRRTSGEVAGRVGAIIGKDLRLFARDRFYLVVSVLGLVAFAAVFWVLPATVETRIPIGIHLPGAERILAAGLDAAGEQGLEVAVFGTDEDLEQAVAEGDDLMAGLSFPPDFLGSVAAGEPTTVRVLLAGEAPEGLRPALEGAVREVAFAIVGDAPPVTMPTLEDMVLGVDRSGQPLSLRDQLRPLLIFIVLMTEMFALGSLVAAEIAQRTVTAVLVTPARVVDVLAAKGLLGTALASGQALLLAAVTGTLAHAPGVLVLALLLGSLLVTGFGLVAGASGQDFVAIAFVSVLFFVPLAIPAFAVLFPGTPALWVQLLPSYGLVEVLVRTTAYGETWPQIWPYLVALAGWCVAAFGVGVAVLGRRVARV